jgi:DUF3102 family protein
MSKAKKTEAPQRRTKLDRIVTQLRAILRRETTSVIEAGKLLIESRDHLEHGEWRSWLVNNFDLSYQTALNYCAAAKYVEQKSNVGHFDFANLSARVLYALADGRYNEQEEAAILIATHEGRVDATRVHAIQQTLNPVADDDTEDAADQEDSSTEGRC